MKLVTAIIKPFELDEVCDALTSVAVLLGQSIRIRTAEHGVDAL